MEKAYLTCQQIDGDYLDECQILFTSYNGKPCTEVVKRKNFNEQGLLSVLVTEENEDRVTILLPIKSSNAFTVNKTALAA